MDDSQEARDTAEVESWASDEGRCPECDYFACKCAQWDAEQAAQEAQWAAEDADGACLRCGGTEFTEGVCDECGPLGCQRCGDTREDPTCDWCNWCWNNTSFHTRSDTMDDSQEARDTAEGRCPE